MLKRLTPILLGITCLTGGLAGCQWSNFPQTVSQTPIPPVKNAPLADPNSLAIIEEDIARKVNLYRRSRNLPPLVLNSQISDQARIHSERMAAKIATFSQKDFEKRAKSIGELISYQVIAENLARNQGSDDPATLAVQEWINSPGNRKNLEGNFDLMGIGVSQNGEGEYYISQILLQKAPVSQAIESPSLPWKKPEDLFSKSPQAQDAFLITLEQETYRQVNQYRLSKNLPPLRFDASISQIARVHSQNMARKTAKFSHDGFEARVKEIGKTHSYKSAAENLAFNKGFVDPVAVSVQGWIDSPGHRKNMEGNFNVTGVGVAKNAEGEYYFTQLFILEP